MSTHWRESPAANLAITGVAGKSDSALYVCVYVC